MIPSNPFVLLIVYLLLVGCVVWVLRWVLAQAGVPSPWSWVIPLIIGILLTIVAFSMAGLPIFA